MANLPTIVLSKDVNPRQRNNVGTTKRRVRCTSTSVDESHATTKKEEKSVKYNPVTGKKELEVTKKEETSTSTLTSHEQAVECWLEEKIQRQAAFKQLEETKNLLVSKNRSHYFTPFYEDVEQAIVLLEQCCQKLESGEFWLNPHIASWFLFGVESSKLGPAPSNVPMKCICCLWTWEEIVDFAQQPRLVSHVLKHTDARFHPKDKNSLVELVLTPEMVSWHIFGCLLFHEIPFLEKRVRPQVRQYINSCNFPRFQRIVIPFDPDLPVDAFFSYNFLLHEPPLRLPLGMQIKGETPISVDYHLLELFQSDELRKAIQTLFKTKAEKNKLDLTTKGQVMKQLAEK